MSKVLNSVVTNPENIRGVLCKILTKNDDSGRHGVLIPIEAYRLFPSINGFVPNIPINYTEEIRTEWSNSGSPEIKNSKYKHYHRYPERRLTRLKSDVNNVPEGTLVIFGRRKDRNLVYVVNVLKPDHTLYSDVLNELGLSSAPGSFFLDLEWSAETVIEQSEAIPLLLRQFDQVKERGYIQTLRSGSTGVGYTFETLLGIEENNVSGPDFMGIELKCFHLKKSGSKTDMDLFLKEPVWIDGTKKKNERLAIYGYYDAEKQRQSLYSSVKIKENSHGLRLSVDRVNECLLIEYYGVPVARYDNNILHASLQKKLKEAAYIGAIRRGKGEKEEFQYQTLTYYTNYSIKEFFSLIENGDVWLELRMHDKHNHGTQFRIWDNKLTDLYARAERLREA